LADFTVVLDDLIDDLKRRDFTINAIAKDVETGEIIDPLNGRKHLNEGILICSTGAPQTLYSDPIRIVRALRFCYLFKFQMDYDLELAIKAFKYSDFFIGKTDRLVRELKKLDLSGKLFIFNKLKELNEPIFDWIDCNIKFTPSKR
jgi:tRNA nucleotidyltransferase (CCA-adding enzyme)